MPHEPVTTQVTKPKTFEELNKPLQFGDNKKIVDRKLTEFRNDIIEKFGSSQVPTPAVKDIYKQCAGGIASTLTDQKQGSAQEMEPEYNMVDNAPPIYD